MLRGGACGHSNVFLANLTPATLIGYGLRRDKRGARSPADRAIGNDNTRREVVVVVPDHVAASPIPTGLRPQRAKISYCVGWAVTTYCRNSLGLPAATIRYWVPPGMVAEQKSTLRIWLLMPACPLHNADP